ncbi:LptF/LptG family permease [Aestuariivirga litoralis]|uniref:LptF/LptG family permease n=1 Tax=Aestuariivirga litoralis TaxID=2650924 RepID=UPI0018C6CA9D|nr:LptF/LptG family permease [Aestuariivirga litoralis]
MSILARMLTRMILIRFAVILLGLSFFVLTLEVVGFLTDVLRIANNPFVAVGTYVLTRTPGILALFLPTSLLLALLLSMTELSYRNELTAIWATGISPSRLIIKLLPMAILVGVAHFLLMDQAVPAAAPSLRSWGIADYATRKLSTNPNDPVWIRSDNDIMRADRMSADNKTLYNVTIFKRAPQGQLTSEIFADTATQKDSHWLLNNVTSYDADGKKPTRVAQATYEGSLRLADNKRVGSPEEMTFSEIRDFAANDGYGVRAKHVYQTWEQKRLTPVIISIVMVILCVPLGTAFRRGGGLGKIFVAGVALGFAYFVSDGLAMTLGETGAVAPWIAAWGPLLVMAAIAFAMLARTDHV